MATGFWSCGVQFSKELIAVGTMLFKVGTPGIHAVVILFERFWIQVSCLLTENSA